MADKGAWVEQALCKADPDLWFADREDQSHAALAWRQKCPVLAECLKWTLATDATSSVAKDKALNLPEVCRRVVERTRSL